jgi:hypothetical protein
MHDPYVYPTDDSLRKAGMSDAFTRDPVEAVAQADVLVLCCSHRVYAERWPELVAMAPHAHAVLDAANLLHPHEAAAHGLAYAGIGRGRLAPSADLIEAVFHGFEEVERGVADEVASLVEFLDRHYASGEFNRLRFSEVQRIAATCPTGCTIVATRAAPPQFDADRFPSTLVRRAVSTAAREISPGLVTP